MRTYKIGTQYEFIVDHFFTDKDDIGRERMWLALSDGESGLVYKVPAYPYQKDGYEGKTVMCKVVNIFDNGYMLLLQDKEEVIKRCYNEGETYWFTIGEKQIDPYSSRPYYKLIDRINGIEWHRYYCSAETVLSGVLGFVAKTITNDHVEFILKDDIETNKTPHIEASLTKNTFGKNPFGHEDEHHEWKSSIVHSAGETDSEEPDMEVQMLCIMKSISGFQNADGGLLYIGVSNNGELLGIEGDYPYLSDGKFSYPSNPDGFENRIRNAVNGYLGKMSLENIGFRFYYQQSSKKVFCIIQADKTPRPIYCAGKDVYKRFGNGYRQLRGDEITELVYDKMNDKSEQAKFERPMPTDCLEYNPNVDVEVPVAEAPRISAPVVKLTPEDLNKLDYYYMTFFTDDSFMYSKESHSSDPNCLTEVRFNKIDGNMEYSRDLLLKCTDDGHAQFVQAYDMCKLGRPDVRISISTKNILTVRVVHKYDFLRVRFKDSENEREKYLRVQSLFGKDTEKTLKANKDVSTIKYEFKLKGNSLIPAEYTITGVDVIREQLPDDIPFVSANRGSKGIGSIVGPKLTIDKANY